MERSTLSDQPSHSTRAIDGCPRPSLGWTRRFEKLAWTENGYGCKRKAPCSFALSIGPASAADQPSATQDWEVAMHVDHGCQETLDLRAHGNPGETEAAQCPTRRPNVNNPTLPTSLHRAKRIAN
jgi:hypothetical protein